MAKLTKEQVLQIPKFAEQGLKNKEIARQLNCHERAVNYWIGRLRDAGHNVPRKLGTPKMKL